MMFNNIGNMQFEAEQIAKSWEGQFRFLKETETTSGLRSPQIGALHALMAHV